MPGSCPSAVTPPGMLTKSPRLVLLTPIFSDGGFGLSPWSCSTGASFACKAHLKQVDQFEHLKASTFPRAMGFSPRPKRLRPAGRAQGGNFQRGVDAMIGALSITQYRQHQLVQLRTDTHVGNLQSLHRYYSGRTHRH